MTYGMKESIITDTYIFKPINVSERELFFKLLMDEPEVQWIYSNDMPESLKIDILSAMMIFYWETLVREDRETFSIYEKKFNEFTGEVCLYKNKYANYEIGISLLKEYRGRGHGKAIIQELSKWLIEEKEILEVDIHVAYDNLQSQKCVENLGAKYVGDDGNLYYKLSLVSGLQG